MIISAISFSLDIVKRTVSLVYNIVHFRQFSINFSLENYLLAETDAIGTVNIMRRAIVMKIVWK